MTNPFPYKEHSVLTGHVGPVHVVRFNRDGEYCLSGGKDRSIMLWNPHKGIRIKEYKGEHGYEVLDIKVCSDNSKFASVGGDRMAFFWDVSTGNIIRRLRGHEGKINCLDFNNDDSVLVCGSYDTTITCWDLRAANHKPMQTITGFKDSVSSLVCTEDSIIAGGVDGSLRQFDIRRGECVIDHVARPITSVRLTTDKNCILVSCLDSRVRLFDKTSGEMLNSYKGHSCKEFSIGSLSTNTDAHIISGSEDKDIVIWNLVEGDVVHRLKGHTMCVCSVDYHPKDPVLVSSSFDGTVRCWK